MANFMNHVYRIFYVGLDRHMFITQKREDKEKQTDEALYGGGTSGPMPYVAPKIGRASSFGFNHDALSTARSVRTAAGSENGDDEVHRAMKKYKSILFHLSTYH